MSKYVKKILDISHGNEFLKQYFSESGDLKSEEEILEILYKDEYFSVGEVPFLMKTPYEKVHLYLLNEGSFASEYVKNICPEIISKALEVNGLLIRYFPNISDELRLKAIQQNSGAIKYIQNPTEEMQLAAISSKDHSFRIGQIKSPTKNVQLTAIRNSGYKLSIILLCPDIEELAEQVYNEMILKGIIQ